MHGEASRRAARGSLACAACRSSFNSLDACCSEDEFTTFDTIHATVGTWNVNGKVPDEDLSSWMTSLRGEDGSLPELVVAGFQEIGEKLRGAMRRVFAPLTRLCAAWQLT